MLPIWNYCKRPSLLFDSLVLHYGQWLSDALYLKLRFRLQTGKHLNLREPKTFSEKLQWLKLHDRRPEYTKMVDKISAKEYVSNIIGQDYIIRLLGVWDNPEDVNWASLPDQFVIKTNHSGGHTGVVICKDKSSFDHTSAIKKLKASLKRDVYHDLREWPYKNVERKVFAEEYIKPNPESGDMPDYKFFCFNGEPKYCQVISGRDTNMCIDFFDQEWNHQPFHEPKHYPFASIEPQKPKHFEKMWSMAKLLAYGKAFCRIDFYDVNDKVYFGEITFYPTSGMGGFAPEEYDSKIGELIDLNKVKVSSGLY